MKTSKSTEMRKRRKALRDLYYLRAMRPPEIADELRERGLAVGMKPAALLNFVQVEVAKLRAEAAPDTILAMGRPAETERYALQLVDVIGFLREAIHSDEQIPVEVVTPRGDTVTVMQPKWDAKQKVAMARDLRTAYEKLAKVRGANVTGLTDADPDAASATKHDDAPFVIETSGKEFTDLVDDNLRGTVN